MIKLEIDKNLEIDKKKIEEKNPKEIPDGSYEYEGETYELTQFEKFLREIFMSEKLRRKE